MSSSFLLSPRKFASGESVRFKHPSTTPIRALISLELRVSQLHQPHQTVQQGSILRFDIQDEQGRSLKTQIVDGTDTIRLTQSSLPDQIWYEIQCLNGPVSVALINVSGAEALALELDLEDIPASLFSLSNVIIVQKTPGPGQFSSILEALQSISDASASNPYVVSVAPGVYTESSTMTIPDFVTVAGETSSVVTVQLSDPNQDIFVIDGTGGARLQGIKVRGATGNGKAGVRVLSSPVTSNITFVIIEDCYHDLIVTSDLLSSVVAVQTVRLGGGTQTHHMMHVESLSGQPAVVRFFSGNTSDTTPGSTLEGVVFVSGPGASCSLTGVIVSSSVGVGAGVILQDGGVLTTFGGFSIDGMDVGVHVPNIGAAPVLSLGSTAITNSATSDLLVEHPGTSGFFSGVADPSKISIDNSSTLGLLFNHTGSMGVTIVGDLNIGPSPDLVTQVTDLLQQTTPTGVIDGGALTDGGGLVIDIAAGFGYCENAVDNKNTRVAWDADSLTLPDDSSVYIYVTDAGVLTFNLVPPVTNENIILGRVRTFGGSILYISHSPLSAHHSATGLKSFLRRALGAIYVSGSLVVENPITDRALDIGSGTYWYSDVEVNPAGGSTVPFDRFYHSSGDLTVATSETQVNNTHYDNGTDLVALTSTYFTKHTLYVIGEGAEEMYYLVHGQAQYQTLVEAEDALLPLPPTDFSDLVVPIAAIIVQEGDANISEIIDIRPRLGFQSPGVSAASTHGNLLGLLEDDHPQYFLIDGTRPMTGDIDLGGQDVVNVALVDGVDVSSHASRHLPNGADALATGTPASIGTANAAGSANALSRQDHVHAHGAQTDGSLHAAATTSVAGFMAAADKSKLDAIGIGQNYSRGESLGDSTITGTLAFQNKISLNVGTVPAGTYRISVSYLWAQSGSGSTGNQFQARVQLDGTTTLWTHAQRAVYNDSAERMPVSTFIFVTFVSSGAHTITLDYAVGVVSATALITGARMEFWQVT